MNRLERIFVVMWLWGVITAAMVSLVGMPIWWLALLSGMVFFFRYNWYVASKPNDPLLK